MTTITLIFPVQEFNRTKVVFRDNFDGEESAMFSGHDRGYENPSAVHHQLFKVRRYAIRSRISTSLNFVPNFGISPWMPSFMILVIRASLFLKSYKLGPSSPRASS